MLKIQLYPNYYTTPKHIGVISCTIMEIKLYMNQAPGPYYSELGRLGGYWQKPDFQNIALKPCLLSTFHTNSFVNIVYEVYTLKFTD
jgi:hypothetical protein